PRLPQIIHDDFCVDLASNTIHYKSNPLSLKRREFFILSELVQNFGETVPTSTLISKVWNSEQEPFSNSLDVHIYNLRKKLRPHNAADRIVTRKAQGYRLE